MREIPMQDALLCYHIVANMLHAGYFADTVKSLLHAWMKCRGLCAGAGSIAPKHSDAPALFHEMDEWIARLTRMESYVTSMA